MFDKKSTAALGMSLLALFVVLMTPAPKPDTSDALREVDRIELMVDSEMSSAEEENKELEKAFANIDELRNRFSSEENAKRPDPSAYAREMTLKEITQRWKEFEARMKVLNSIRASKKK